MVLASLPRVRSNPRHLATWLALFLLPWFVPAASGIGEPDPSFQVGKGANGPVTSILPLPSGQILVGGLFTTFNGETRRGLVRLQENGTVDAGFDLALELIPEGGVFALRADAEGRIYVGGAFTRAGGRAASGLVRLHADGTLDTGFSAALPAAGAVAAVALAADGQTLWVGGTFASGTQATPLHQLTLTGATAPGFSPPPMVGGDLPLVLTVLPMADGGVLAGGEFALVAGESRQHLVRLDRNGRVGAPIGAEPSVFWTDVSDLHLADDGRLYVAASETSTAVVVVLEPDGSWNRRLSFGAWDMNGAPASINRLLPLERHRLLVGGTFSHLLGQAKGHLARLHADVPELDHTFTATPNGPIITLAEDAAGRILVSGEFTAIDDQPAPGLARLLRTGDLPRLRETLASRTVGEGGNVWLRPRAVGFDGVEWSRDGVPVVASTADDFALVSARPGDSGVYQARLYNRFGEVTTEPVTLTVGGSRIGRAEPAVVLPRSEWIAPNLKVAPRPRGGWVTFDEHDRRVAYLRADLVEERVVQLPPTATEPTFLGALAVADDDTVWLSGHEFTFVGQPVTQLVRVRNGELDLTFWPSGATGVSKILPTPDGGTVTVGGYQSRIRRYGASGELLFETSPLDLTSGILLPDGKVLYGWGRDLSGGAINLGRLNADGSSDPSWQPPVVRVVKDGTTHEFDAVSGVVRSPDGALIASLSADRARSSGIVWMTAEGQVRQTYVDPGSYQSPWAVLAATEDGGVVAARHGVGEITTFYADGRQIRAFESQENLAATWLGPREILVHFQVSPANDPIYDLFRIPLEARGESRLVNLSGRGYAGSGSETLIAGFVPAAAGGPPLLLRGLGPNLVDFGLAGVATNPRAELFQGETAVAANDDWDAEPAEAGLLAQTAETRGAFSLRGQLGDAALRRVPGSGPHSLQVSAGAGTPGVALAEIYAAPDAPLVNLSLRGSVRLGERSLIGGFVLHGDGPRWVLVRAVGPGLTPFGVADHVPNPRIELFRGDQPIAANDDWQTSGREAFLAAANRRTGAFPLPTGSTDATLLVELPPGTYTCVVAPADQSPGIGLLEIYHLD